MSVHVLNVLVWVLSAYCHSQAVILKVIHFPSLCVSPMIDRSSDQDVP